MKKLLKILPVLVVFTVCAIAYVPLFAQKDWKMNTGIPEISLRENEQELANRDLCKKALPPTAETQTQVFGCFRPQYLLILPKYPLNPPQIPDNQASGPPFRRQQAHLAC